MKVIGIDLGSSGLKVVELFKVRNQINLVKLREIPFELSADRDKEIAWIEAAQLIQKEFDLKNAKVVVSLPIEIFSSRAKLFPFSDRYKIAKSLPFELEDELPPSQDEAIIDFRGLIPKGNEFLVVGFASSVDKISSHKIRLDSVNLKYDILTCEGIGLSNLCSYRGLGEFAFANPENPTGLDLSSEGPHPAQLFVQIGHQKTLIHVLHQDGQLMAVKQIHWGADAAIRKISTTYEIPYLDAAKEFREKAFILLNTQVATYDQVIFSNLISSEYEVLGRELNLLKIELEHELDCQFNHVTLCGGGSQVTHLGPFLTQVLQMPCEMIDLRGALTQGISPEDQAKFANSLGIALEGYRPAKSPSLQFLKGSLAPSKDELQRLWKKWGTAIQVGGALLVALFTWSALRLSFSESYLNQVEDELRKTAISLAGLPAAQVRPERIERHISSERARIRTTKALMQSLEVATPIKILQDLSQALPPRTELPIEIRSLTLRDQTLNLEGILTQERHRALLQEALTKMAQGGRVQVSPGSGVREAGRSPFRAQVEMKRF